MQNRNETIYLLLVDDNKMHMAMKAVLVNDFDKNCILKAENGLEALELLRKHQTDKGNKIKLVLTDIEMPEMNGNELTMQINEHYPEVDVMTHSTILPNPSTSKLPCFRGHLFKPNGQSKPGSKKEDFYKLLPIDKYTFPKDEEKLKNLKVAALKRDQRSNSCTLSPAIPRLISTSIDMSPAENTARPLSKSAAAISVKKHADTAPLRKSESAPAKPSDIYESTTTSNTSGVSGAVPVEGTDASTSAKILPEHLLTKTRALTGPSTPINAQDKRKVSEENVTVTRVPFTLYFVVPTATSDVQELVKPSSKNSPSLIR